jgi:hypothetical protein
MAYNNGQPHLFTFKRTRATGALVLYVDGVQAGAVGGTQSLLAPARLVLGAQQTLNNFLSGDIAEVKIYDTPLSDSDRGLEEGALRCKYGLGAGTPPAVPTGLAASGTNRQALVTWQPAIGASSYQLKRSTNAGGPFLLLAAGVTGTNYVDSTVINGATNYYVVSSVNACGSSLDSAVVSVFLPLPALETGFGTEGFSLVWPGWADDWQLQSATNLAPPIGWALVTNAPASSNGQFVLTIPVGDQARFFRLASP